MSWFFFQPDKSVTPFLDSLIDNTGISDVFSVQLCGDKFEQKTDRDIELGGSIVSWNGGHILLTMLFTS